MKTKKFDYLIIGSGIAGLSVAKELLATSKIALITKNIIEESATQYAQGGIAAAIGPDDAPNLHFNDTVAAGDGLCNDDAVKILVEEGPDLVKELIKLGTNFDKKGQEISLTKEAAHKKRRILHSGDKTGKEIEKSLSRLILNNPNLTLFENTSVLQLIIKDNECVGCVAIRNDEIIIYKSKAIFIATGGCGQVYSKNTNPPVVTGDGIAIAFEAGAEIQDMEFIQFHPTTLYLGDKKPISLFLISEVIRGEGATLRNIYGDRFMPNYHKNAELAPRDVVARAIFNEMEKTKRNQVFLDLSNIKGNLKDRFPTINRRCKEAKIDITKDFIPVAPAAHYFMGGIKTNNWGHTSIKRLYAIGEVASIGIHGANRLASNSLLDGLVFGHRSAKNALLNYQSFPDKLKNSDLSKYLINDPISKQTKIKMLTIKQKIREIMWAHVGIIRNDTTLSYALKKLLKQKWILKIHTLQPNLKEIQNMLIICILVTLFAKSRKESRGGHFRSDWPKKDDTTWKTHQIFSRRQIKPKKLTVFHQQ